MFKQSQQNQTMQDDLAHRSPDINWPNGFDPMAADLFSHNQLLINAPVEKVWRHLIEVLKWPTWYPNAKEVSVINQSKDTLQEGSIFQWITFGIPLESKVNEFLPYSRLSWYGYAPGTKPSFYHTWYIVPQGSGACLVVTDEVGKGPDAAALRENNEGLMHRGHDLWLATLKWVAEDTE